jgi:hypothetical protein
MRGLPGDSESGENPIMPNSFEKEALIVAPLKLAIIQILEPEQHCNVATTLSILSSLPFLKEADTIRSLHFDVDMYCQFKVKNLYVAFEQWGIREHPLLERINS